MIHGLCVFLCGCGFFLYGCIACSNADMSAAVAVSGSVEWISGCVGDVVVDGFLLFCVLCECKFWKRWRCCWCCCCFDDRVYCFMVAMGGEMMPAMTGAVIAVMVVSMHV